MKGINKVIIVGAIGQDPETHATEQSQVTRISVATNEKWKDAKTGEDKEETEWHSIIFFGQLSVIASQYLKKGDKVYVEGRLKTKKYVNKEGVEKQATQMIANNLQMLGGQPANKPQAQAQPQQQPQASHQPPPYGEYKRKREAPPSQAQLNATNEFYNDDVPF